MGTLLTVMSAENPTSPDETADVSVADTVPEPTGRGTGASRADERSMLPWVVSVWSVVALFGAVTLVRSHQIGIPLRDPHGEVFLWRSLISLGIFVVMVPLDGIWRSRRSGDRSLRGAVAVLRARWTARRLTLALTGLLAFHIVYFCYHNLKSWDVFNAPQDARLEQWDKWIFLGHSPASLLHDLLGQHIAAYVLMVIYESFTTLVTIAYVAAVVFPEKLRDSYVFIASALWIWILGVASYYLIPSLGPFNIAPQDFAGLPHTMIQETQARYMDQRSNMLANPQAPGAFAQVSAFASLHVGVITTIVLMSRFYRLRRTTRVLAVYLVGVMIATVYLGWHFFVDDLAGLFIAWLAVFIGIRMIYPKGRPEPETATR